MKLHCQLRISAAVHLIAVIITTAHAQRFMTSQCVKDGSPVELMCPVDYDYYDGGPLSWESTKDEWDYEYDESSMSFTATLSTGSASHDVQEITCDYNGQYFHAVIIVTDEQHSALPIFPKLQQGNRHSLNLSWENPRHPYSDFNDEDNVYYNYTIVVTAKDGYQETLSLDVESHNTPIKLLELAGHECQHLTISISLPGNCEDKQISGYLLITPQQFQQPVSSETLFSRNGDWTQVHITFTPPDLCPLQNASYVLSFNDGNETWSREPVAITNTSQTVREDIATGLEKDKNYTLNVTVITDYGNATSTTSFSTHSILGAGQPSNLKITGYNMSNVLIGWVNPRLPASSFTYVITASNPDSGGHMRSTEKPFLRDEEPLFSLDLEGFECKRVLISVSLYGEEEEALQVEAVLPSYSTVFVQDVRVDTSLNRDNSIREAEIFFTPPRLCDAFQSSSYMLIFTDGNETWPGTGGGPVAITNSLQPVEVEVETGFMVDTDYTVTVIVFTEYANMSSSAGFRFQLPVSVATEDSSAVSSTVVGGAVGGAVVLLVVVLLCGFGTGVVAVYLLRQRKRKHQMQGKVTARGPMVTNPIYEAGEGVYEELPENPPSSGQFMINTNAPAPSAAMMPNLPPPRKTDPQEVPSLSEGEKSAMAAKLGARRLASLGNLSASSQLDEAEDCYTVMSPAGTLTVLPRNRHSMSSLGGGTPWPMGGAL